jgi:hypothetical protein
MLLTPSEVIKGPHKPNVAIEALYHVRQKDTPKYPEGKSCLVALAFDAPTKTWTVHLIEEANPDNIKEAKAAK